MQWPRSVALGNGDRNAAALKGRNSEVLRQPSIAHAPFGDGNAVPLTEVSDFVLESHEAAILFLTRAKKKATRRSPFSVVR